MRTATITQGAINHAELLAGMKAKTHRELREHRVICKCGKRRLARFVAGPDDSGELKLWVMVPDVRILDYKAPAWANTVMHQPHPGNPCTLQPMPSVCNLCDSGAVILAPCMRIDPTTHRYFMLRINSTKAAADPWTAGDNTLYFELSRSSEGPGGTQILHFDKPPTRGTVTA